jgi:phospholipid/cholesterol/gamma-HCH transport system substrate-binding protein
MKQKQLEYLVGGFVLLGLAAVLYLTVKLGAGSLLGSDSYRVEVRF